MGHGWIAGFSWMWIPTLLTLGLDVLLGRPVLAIIALMLFSAAGALAQTGPQNNPQKPMQRDVSTMDMDPYFTTLNYPVPQDTMMVMLLSDFQSARSTNDFFTGMGMVQYGLTPRWTVGFMAEGQKISGFPTTYGGLRINSYFRVFPHDHLLNFTLYGEYEGLNGAALYKMEVAGFGGEERTAGIGAAHARPYIRAAGNQVSRLGAG